MVGFQRLGVVQRALDVEAAQAALAASSYGSAENLPKLRITPRGSNEFNNRALTAVIEFWRQNLGIENVEFQQDPNSFGDDYDKINLSRDDVVIRFPDAATYMWAAGNSAGSFPSSSMLNGYYNEALEAAVDEAPTLAPDDPRRCELALEAQAQYEGDYVIMRAFQGPSAEHALGTDDLGRDEFSRMLHGARTAALVAFFTTAISLVIGVLVGRPRRPG